MAEWQQQQFGQVAAEPSESAGNSLGSKRQRRPSVRLGEIGDAPAAFVSEAYFKRKKQLRAAYENVQTFPYQSPQPRHDDGTVNPDGNDSPDSFLFLAKAARAAKTRPLVHVAVGKFHKHNFTYDDYDRQRHGVPTDPVSPGAVQAENLLALQTSAPGGIYSMKATQNPRNIGKKGRNRKRRRGGPRGLAPLEKLARAIPSIIEIDENENEKASGMEDTTDPLSDEHYDADTPEGFRDCDLETSEGFRDTKELSYSQEIDPPESSPLDVDSKELSESWQLKTGDGFLRNQKGVSKLEEGSDNHPLGPTGAAGKDLAEPIPEMEASPIPETKAQPAHDVNTRSKAEANGHTDDRDPLSENTDEQPESIPQRGRLCAGLKNGVRGWLHGLGLGKYAQVYEAHEVDAEVLPLLTLEDLREMGINVVGPRRKMFCAIQQLRKSLLARADSL